MPPPGEILILKRHRGVLSASSSIGNCSGEIS
jgi:hypothetical protein